MSGEHKEKKQEPSKPPVLGQVTSPLPRVTIQFCTQCRWMLRAAYYAQELLSTFGLALSEVALQPSTGGTFVVAITTPSSTFAPEEESREATATTTKTLWDRKVDGGFPETKELKRRVRDVIEPGRDLGHVDRDHKKPGDGQEQANVETAPVTASGKEDKCEDCQ
ncbi:hypothetical protein NLU13_2829 [Sarocladium strictum]|uniref:Uncharacterized protein n=1 Tax=Sarocladium strictum TaxID=5046 RepID=A0AA39L9W0_SARSR|nr:hypothetical protein NLU13_2829 [Sarocladium strictum]